MCHLPKSILWRPIPQCDGIWSAGPLNIYNNEHLLNTYKTDFIQGTGNVFCPCGPYNFPGKTVSVYVLAVAVKDIVLSNLIGFVIF